MTSTWCSFGFASKQEIVVADTKQAGQGLKPQQVTLEVDIAVAMDPGALQLIHLGLPEANQKYEHETIS